MALPPARARAIGLKAVYVLLTAGVMLALFNSWAYDDPFITYRYADNLRRGLGLVYNPGERVLSTTTPLFTLLLSVLGGAWPDAHLLANLVSALSLAAGGLLLWELARAWQAPAAGWASLALYPTFTLLLRTFSSETLLYLCFCIAAFLFYARRKYLWTALMAALAVLTRADGALVALVIGAHYVIVRLWQEREAPAWSAAGLFLGVVVPWFLFAWLYYGSPLPVTLAAKQQQGAMAISQKFAPGFVLLVRDYAGRWPYWLEAGLALLGLGYAAARARRWLLFLAWPAVYFAAYSALGVTRYFWYYAPLVPGFVAAVGLGLEALVRLFSASRVDAERPSTSLRSPVEAGRDREASLWEGAQDALLRSGRLLAALVLGVLLLAQAGDVLFLRRHPDNRYRVYRAVGEWLSQNTEAGATVGALEVGILGYYAERPMVDFAGLIQPDVAQQLTHTTTYEDASRWAIQTYRPAYLALNPDWFPQLTEQVVLPDCAAQQAFPGEPYGYPGRMVVYRCEW